jgi:hypothetical protein
MILPLEGKSAPWRALTGRAYESKLGRSLPSISSPEITYKHPTHLVV